MVDGTGKMSRTTVVLLVAALGLSFYFMFSYSGPFRWLAELQLRWWSSYSEKLTFVLTYLLLLAAGALLVWPYRAGSGRAPAADGRGAMDVAADLWDGLGGVGHFGAKLLAVGAILLAMGWWDQRRLSGDTTLTDLPVERLEAGEPPPSRWVNLSAVPLVTARLTFASGSSKDQDSYVPLVSEGHDPSASVSAFAKYGGGGKTRPPSRAQLIAVRGLIAPGGLPGPVRADYERTGLLRDGQTYYLVEPDKDPATQRRRARDVLRIGGAIAGGGALLMVVGFAWTGRRGVK